MLGVKPRAMHKTKFVQPWKAKKTFKLQLCEARVVMARSNVVYNVPHTHTYL